MITIERKVGRLVEIRVVGQPEMKQFGRVIALANEVGPDSKVVVLVDVRKAIGMTPEYVEKLGLMIRSSAQRVAQAVVVRGGGGLVKYAASAKVARVAGPVAQRFVDGPEDALAALSPVVDAAELARARRFLEEGE